MTYLPSLPDSAVLLDVFRAYPQTPRPLLDYHQALLRGPSPLTVSQRELIAAYVSGLNACGYCHGVHAATAQAFGVGEDTLSALLADLSTAPVPDRMRPLLRYVSKLTLSPAKITPADAEAVLAAGWEEQALHDAAAVCGLFNMMNRLAEGLGISAGEDYFRTAASRLAGGGYAGLKDLLRQPGPASPPVSLLTIAGPGRRAAALTQATDVKLEEDPMARATWNGVVLAETDHPVLLEGNVYFPPGDVRREHLAATRAWSVCPWKGLARYYTVRAGGLENKNAAWYYPHPSPLARKIKNHVAFWGGVEVDLAAGPRDRASAAG